MTILNKLRLPPPLDRDSYHLLRHGIADDPNIDVYINEGGDFAFLDPMPVIDYSSYLPRVQSLGVQAYKKTSDILEQRLIKISPVLASVSSFLEIGAADAAFLAMIHDRFPAVGCYSIEPDQNTRAARDALPWLRQSSSLTEAIKAGTTADLIAMFHVFEHIAQPAEFLASVRQVLSSSGRLLIEVPSLTDPLLSLYASSAYQSFYFQCQHPYVYSGPSLERVLAANGFTVEYFIPHQRYSLENHLQWLTAARPGGNPQFRNLFADVGDCYRACLEQAGKTDTIIVLAKAMA
jgi:hypothetical protein